MQFRKLAQLSKFHSDFDQICGIMLAYIPTAKIVYHKKKNWKNFFSTILFLDFYLKMSLGLSLNFLILSSNLSLIVLKKLSLQKKKCRDYIFKTTIDCLSKVFSRDSTRHFVCPSVYLQFFSKQLFYIILGWSLYSDASAHISLYHHHPPNFRNS